MKNKDKIIIITLMFIIIVGGMLLYKQGKDISNLKQSNENIVNIKKTNKVNNSNDKIIKEVVKKEEFNQASETEKQLTNNTKRIIGTIISVSNDSFVVKSSIVDISALKNIDYSKSTVLPNIDKEFNIKINNETIFHNINKKILKKGQIVDIISDDLIYKTDNLNAIKISSFMNLLK